ncbi:MAG: Glucose--fructose oxidoreductase precursor [Candidatus Latescibacteria bacterium ADurb.Bin168]|nr:MAG: Glucose--fructose oxidoreductase precursor [Candidatus Latescibacteria bacterium ADurb.Bin168]
MDYEPVKFGVVGLGMGQHHCKAIAAANGAELVAVCDIDMERTNKMVQTYGCKGYSSYAEFLNHPGMEAVCICVPSGMHADFGIQAIQTGKHLVVEKPPDVKAAKVQALIDAAAARGVKMEQIFQQRTSPLNRRIKDVIDSGRLGKLVGINALLPWYRAQSYYEDVAHGRWKGTWALDGGGSLANQGVHTMDIVLYFFGRVKSVFGKFGVFTHDIEAEDHTVAILKFENGAMGTIMTTTCAYRGTDQILVLFGSRGQIRQSTYLEAWQIMHDDDPKREKEKAEEQEMLALYGPREARGETTANDPWALSSDGHQAHIEDLVRAIRTNTDTMSSPVHAKHDVEVIEAIFESGRTGKEVFLS